ncbi:hypothetical protein, partial [Mesotoga prima]|uniref:hypothetical protein n=2 Tax=Mesotoga TaxID=1184396 RepID=UPI002BB0B543
DEVGTGLCEAKTGQAEPDWPAPADWLFYFSPSRERSERLYNALSRLVLKKASMHMNVNPFLLNKIAFRRDFVDLITDRFSSVVDEKTSLIGNMNSCYHITCWR